MIASRVVAKTVGVWQRFCHEKSGNIAVIAGLLAVPLLTGVGAAVDTTRAISVRSAVQVGLDSTALSLMKQAAGLSNAQLTTAAKDWFAGNFNRPEASNIQISASYDQTSKSLTVTGYADVQTSFMTVLGYPKVTVNTASTATLGGTQRLPVCVLVTNPNSDHTFLVKNQATVNFTNCLVQVNTQNWDAVEARDTSYIHSANGVNCFTGDIHYGDVQPPKQATCTLLPDPYESYTVPTNACTFNNKSVSSATTLLPGTYCGGIKITGGNVTFSPGVYYIQNGDLAISGSSMVTANGVTFLMSGPGSNINISTSGTVTMSPDIDPSAGQWAGFQFYNDQPSAVVIGKKGTTAIVNVISGTKMTMSGVVYLAGQTLSIINNADVKLDPGVIVTDFLLPDHASLTLSSMTGSSNPALFTKTIAAVSPILIK